MSAATDNAGHVDSEKSAAVPQVEDLGNDKSRPASAFKQDGVLEAEAITQVWTKPYIITMFVLIYLMTFIRGMQDTIQSNLSAYVTSSFDEHGLSSTISVVATIIGGVSSLTIAKIIDVIGRIQGLVFMVLLSVVGQIMKAVCKNIETYAAAHTLYWVGSLGILYVLSVVVSDMTTLKNRLVIFGLNSTPTLITVFAGSNISQLYYERLNFRWAFGSWAIITAAFAIPMLVILARQSQKAKALGVLRPKSSRTATASFKYYFVNFDIVGLVLVTAGWALLLLPFSLATSAPHGWKTGYIIAMIVVGGVCLIAFCLWEQYGANVQYLPWRYLRDRGILGGSLCYGFMFLSIYCWDTYYYSYLQVVNNQSISASGYIVNAFSVGAAFLSPFIGLLVSYTGNYKYVGASGIPLMVLGTALLIKFRNAESSTGYLVMCQLLNGFGSGFLSMTSQMAVMAPVTHQEVAVVLAIYSMFGSIGAAIGETIAGALWTNQLPGLIYKELPAEYKYLTADIYASLAVQISYPMGSEVRTAIINAYATLMHRMVIAGAVFLIPTFISVLAWQNINLKTKEEKEGTQSKGNLF